MRMLHPDKLRALQAAASKNRAKKPKPAQPGIMANLAAQMYQNRQAQQRRRIF